MVSGSRSPPGWAAANLARLSPSSTAHSRGRRRAAFMPSGRASAASGCGRTGITGGTRVTTNPVYSGEDRNPAIGELLYCASLTKAARDLDISIRFDRLRLRAAQPATARDGLPAPACQSIPHEAATWSGTQRRGCRTCPALTTRSARTSCWCTE